MHCPKCGGQQSSNEVKFCSRCGFYLGVVTELLNLDGTLPGREVAVTPPGRSGRKKKIRQGAKLLFFGAALVPIALGLSIVNDTPGPLILPLLLFLAGLFWMTYHRLFTDEDASVIQYTRQAQGPPPRPMLRPEDNRMRVAEPQRLNTADMAHPPSAVDHTTQLFDKE
ncbi:MAG TPA: hypothetical protein VKC34_18510 [Blastocatellia bacterium]|nr:hypothetical protein [Blastocatellia bacterium]